MDTSLFNKTLQIPIFTKDGPVEHTVRSSQGSSRSSIHVTPKGPMIPTNPNKPPKQGHIKSSTIAPSPSSAPVPTTPAPSILKKTHRH